MSGSDLPPRLGAVDLDSLDRDGALREAADVLARPTRGELLRRTATAAAGGAVLLGAAATAPGPASAADRRGDFAILNYALSLEYLQAAFYTEAERRGALTGAFARQAEVVGAHERAHVAALRSALGSAAIARPSFDFRGVTEDQSGFRRTAVAFEDLGTAAYKDRAPHIRSAEFLAAALRIHSVEARHAAWIRRLAGVLPAPDAFDEPLPEARVREIVGDTRFVVQSTPVTTSRRRPRYTG